MLIWHASVVQRTPRSSSAAKASSITSPALKAISISPVTQASTERPSGSSGWAGPIGPTAPTGDDSVTGPNGASMRASAMGGLPFGDQAAASSDFAAAKAQSSQGVSASTSAVSTVAPHQMRRPAGASR